METKEILSASAGQNKVRRENIKKFKKKCEDNGKTMSDVLFDLVNEYNKEK
ncbi:MAG: hypothetical protein M0R80_27710 [Proteobacteria bacterium]|jgi:hypothetical protein|nr:hypothetical protein [Pseudomonadota bacterium]